MDPDLRGCARKGHITYRPTGPGEERLADRLHAQTPAGEAWRCLRCATFVVDQPPLSGPAGEAPQVLRGKALRSARILRLLAVERFLRALLLALVGYALLRFESSQSSVQQLFNRAIPAAKPLARVFDYDLDTSPTVDRIRHLIGTSHSEVQLIAILLFIYAGSQVLEGVGLALLKRWGEYVAATFTAVFLPFEVYELTEKVSVLRVGALAINVAAVIYLVLSKRLFGVRGGGEAYEAQLRGEALLEVEQAADESPAEELVSTG